MKKSLLLGLLLIGCFTLIGCQKSEGEPKISESKYPIAEQVCIDNEGEVTIDDEGTPVCILGDRTISLADMEENTEENVKIANPASVYCEENGGTLKLEEGAGLCIFDDGSYCEEWSYFRGECKSGEIIYNTVNEQPEIGMANPASVYCIKQGGKSIIMEDEEGNQYGVCRFSDGTEIEEREYFRANNSDKRTSKIYSDEDLQAAIDTIMNEINNNWKVKIEMQELLYEGDETAVSNLEYCQDLNPNITDCAVFSSNFYIPAQDVQMAGAFEPNTNINGYTWILGRANAGEWIILTNGFA